MEVVLFITYTRCCKIVLMFYNALYKKRKIMRKITHSLFGCTFFINKYWLHFYKYKECSECGKRHKQVECSAFGDKSWEQII